MTTLSVPKLNLYNEVFSDSRKSINQNNSQLKNDDYNDYRKINKTLDSKLENTNHLINNLTDNLENITDEEFQSRLNQLKKEHQKTLEICEKMYFQNNSPMQPKNEVEIIAEEFSKKITGKPPVGGVSRDTQQKSYDFARDCATTSLGYESEPNDQFDTSSLTNRRRLCWSNEENDEDWSRASSKILPVDRRINKYQRDESFERLTQPGRHVRRHACNNGSAAHMWPHHADALSDDNEETGSQARSAHHRNATGANWKHRVTVPKPFKMTLRDEEDTRRRKKAAPQMSRSMRIFEEERAQKLRAELDESRKQFRANPVPSHVYLPLYESLLEEQETRRQFVRNYSKQILRDLEKPFKFHQRELDKERQKHMSSTGATDEITSEMELIYSNPHKMDNSKRPGSTQAPLKSYHGERVATTNPRHYQHRTRRSKSASAGSGSSDRYRKERVKSEKLREDELLRQIERNMRAKTMLQQSAMPAGVAANQRRQDMKRQNKRDAEQDADQASRLAMAGRPAPDFTRIHRDWDKHVMMQEKQPSFTRTKPFNLSASNKRKDQHNEDNDYDGEAGNLKRSESSSTFSYDWNQSILASMEIPRPATNKSTMLRQKKLNEKVEADLKIINQQRIAAQSSVLSDDTFSKSNMRNMRKDAVTDSMKKSMDGKPPKKVVHDYTEKRKNELIKTDLRRNAEYQKDLEEMESRIRQNPLLVERQSLMNAKRKAEKDIDQVLKSSQANYSQHHNPENKNIYDQEYAQNHFGNSTRSYELEN